MKIFARFGAYFTPLIQTKWLKNPEIMGVNWFLEDLLTGVKVWESLYMLCLIFPFSEKSTCFEVSFFTYIHIGIAIKSKEKVSFAGEKEH